MTQSLRTLLTPWALVAVSALVAVGAVAYALMSSARPASAYIAPTVGTVTEEVDTTGTVKAATTADLSFQVSGRITSVQARVGQYVAAGQVLATLSSSDLKAQLDQAKANLAMQQAKFASLQAGATVQAVGAAQTSVTNTQTALTQAKQGVVQASQAAYSGADDAIHNRVDQFFTNPRTFNPTLNLSLTDSPLQQSIVSGRVSMESLLAQWQSYVNSQPTDASAVDAAGVAVQTRGYITQVNTYLDTISQGLTKAISTTQNPTSVIQGYQASVSLGRQAMSGVLATLNGAESSVKAAASSLGSAQAQLNVVQAPPTQNDVAAQQAAVNAAQAAIDLAQAQLDKTVIVAPVSGTITVSNVHVGETAASGAPIISMISDSQFQMEGYVSEADIAKLKVGNAASVMLDAYQSVPFTSHIVTIDPAATTRNSISSYKVTVQFDRNDQRIRAGMSGTVVMVTQTHQHALSIPSTAVITRGAQTYVLKKAASNDDILQPITIGITGKGMSEIVSGLTVQDQVRSFGQTK